MLNRLATLSAAALLATLAGVPVFAQGHDHGAHGNHQGHGDAQAAAPAKSTTKAVDPVCGMEIEKASAVAKSVYAGKTYYFCSEDEKAKFDKDPESFLKKG